jgi:hypothetical protein
MALKEKMKRENARLAGIVSGPLGSLGHHYYERFIMYKSEVLLMAVLGCLVCLSGCRQECVTREDNVSFPIILSSQTNRVCKDNGTLNIRENGSACILANWNNDRTYDANGTLVQYDDRNGIWPFYSINATKTGNSERSDVTILLFLNFTNEKHL